MMTQHPWWRGAVVYQIYLRSFCDGNGDGQGDFAGLISKLDYISALGVDAIWLSPIHPSPNRDWGYDVSDYEDVHPDYGSLADFETLLAAAHSRGLKVLLDEVLCHTSDEHAWFAQSQLKDDAKAHWYVWADPREDGTAPNNWLSAFAGPAWAYKPSRRQYYHHKFLRQQPKVNWQNAAAREAALNVLDFWLERGVDGFRLDVANAYLHDTALTDNPPVPLGLRNAFNWEHAPNLQRHLHDSNLVENIAALEAIRRTVDRHANRFVFGEFSEEAERAGCYAAPNEGLHSGYSFPMLLQHKLDPAFFRSYFAMLARHPAHWPCVSFSNHDVMRTVSRYGGGNAPSELAKMMLALLFSLRGTVLMYQGEELGLPEADLRRDQLRDPVGDLYYPQHKGRDGCRTPMPWDADAVNLGFTNGTPWLPVSPLHKPLAVSVQGVKQDLTLKFARDFLLMRKASPALRFGEIEFLDAPAPILAFVRRHELGDVICVFNMSADETEFVNSSLAGARPLSGVGENKNGALRLCAYGTWLAQI